MKTIDYAARALFAMISASAVLDLVAHLVSRGIEVDSEPGRVKVVDSPSSQ